MIFRTVIAISAIAIGVTAAMAQQDAVKTRKDLMGSIAKPYYGVLARMNRGQAPFDQAAADAALTSIANDAPKLAAAFATNVMPASQSDYDSSPKIWQNKADFDAKVASFIAATTASRGAAKDLDSLKVAFQNVTKTCDSCHETYRVKNR